MIALFIEITNNEKYSIWSILSLILFPNEM